MSLRGSKILASKKNNMTKENTKEKISEKYNIEASFKKRCDHKFQWEWETHCGVCSKCGAAIRHSDFDEHLQFFEKGSDGKYDDYFEIPIPEFYLKSFLEIIN